MNRLSALDTEFLHVEDDSAHMQIAGVCVFDDPPPPLADFRALIDSKLHLLERYRQCVRFVPLELGRPVWVDDPHFHLDYHVRHTALPAPGDQPTLERLMGRLLSAPLDHRRPLWEAWLVEGLANQRWAIVFKLHHCMVDGIAGVELLTQLLDLDPDIEVAPPQPWEPQAGPSGMAMVLDAWGGLIGDAWEWAAKTPTAILHPAETLKGAADTVKGLTGFLRHASLTPAVALDGRIGPHRVWASSESSMGDVATIRSAFGGTINDVVLAAVTGGYRELLISIGEDPGRAVVRSLIPVSVRGGSTQAIPENRVSTLLYELPVGIADPIERLRTVHEQMQELKGSHMAETGEMLTSITNLAPPMVVGVLTRLAVRAEHIVAQRVVNTVTTNVPGPQFPLYCLGREMLEYRPFVPISHGVRIGTAILSYNGHLFFGVTGDYGMADAVRVVADSLTESITELRGLALGAEAGDPPPTKRVRGWLNADQPADRSGRRPPATSTGLPPSPGTATTTVRATSRTSSTAGHRRDGR